MKMIFDEVENRYLFVRDDGSISKYINEFHRQSVERCLNHIEKNKHIPINVEEEIERISTMHREIALRYLQGN